MTTEYGYTKPRLHDYSGNLSKGWYIGFSMTDPATGIRKAFQLRLNINSIKLKSERYFQGRLGVKLVSDSLAGGWNPFEELLESFLDKEREIVAPINHKTLIQAIDFGLDNGSWSKKTKQCYKGTADFYKEAAKSLGLHNIPIQKVTKQHVMQITNKVKKDRSWSNKSVNKNVIYFAAVLKVVKDWEIIPHNPAHDITRLPETESEKYIPYTAQEKKDIHKALFVDHFRFYVIFMITYHTGIRPKEVLALKVRDINLSQDEIKIIPDSLADNSKNKKIRRVPINPHLKQLFLRLDLLNYPSDYYVFGSPYPKGGNHIHGYKRMPGTSHPDYFKPSLNRIPRNNITRQWKELIWKGEGIHKFMYAAKHTGGDDKLLAGVDLDALKDMYGHYSTQMTEKYLSKLKQVHKQKIIEKSPDFL